MGCCGPTCIGEDDQLGIIGPAVDQPGLLGIADRLFEGRAGQADVAPMLAARRQCRLVAPRW
jgi:hypothetical protein